ncbi:hypothetical protein MYRNA_41 [Mycobacterium phage Myrna]|uniref:Uncharacterized protein n=1 Tax=Mycobacterium phage Myrna TaxID=546805 RepID=B5LJ52_9CAUD|nr:gp41 [Mycobacterium phage Myrna]ACH62049.1 hypothetical protein MYRNA_41 [Mycobacterium phage Myrna]
MPEELTPVERSRRMKAAQTLHEASTILSVYKKGDLELAQKLMDIADEIAPNQGQ